MLFNNKQVIHIGSILHLSIDPILYLKGMMKMYNFKEKEGIHYIIDKEFLIKYIDKNLKKEGDINE